MSPEQTVQVTAITTPNLAWAWKLLSWGTNLQQVSCAGAGRQNVTCQMRSDPAQSVQIDIYDLTALTPSSGTVSGNTVKVYEAANAQLTLTATTDPDDPKVWKLIKWKSVLTAGQGADGVSTKPAGNQTAVALSKARDVKVTATLGCDPASGQKTIEAIVHVCAWPNLEVQEIDFDSRPVLNDGRDEIGKAFDKKWIKGRSDPVTGCITQSSQSPICYPVKTRITIGAIFNVLTKPTEDETVWVYGRATIGGTTLVWTEEVVVRADADKVQIWDATSDQPLPDGVALHDPLTINWYMSLPDKVSWREIGSTKHLLYVTLDEPASDEAYWTLLDISCGAAKGKTTESEFVKASFLPFTTHTGDGKGFPRKGDGLKLSYYKHGWKTQRSPAPLYNDPWTTRGILGGLDASGRCGGWANLLLTMWALHGVTSATQRWYVRSLDKELVDMNQRFLVKNIVFPDPPTLAGLYTHKGAETLKTKASPGAPGQGKTNPQFDFGDHVVIKHSGKLYDPSYGLGPYLNDKMYLAAALDGLGNWAKGKLEFATTDGTPQHIPSECVSYTRGFAEYRIGGETLADVAAEWSTTAQQLLDWDPVLKLKRGTPDKVVPGDTVVIPSNPPTFRKIKTNEITFDMIATAFGTSKQVIFDHPRNSVLKALRKTPDKVVAGDRIIVSWDLVSNCAWVFGHDL